MNTQIELIRRVQAGDPVAAQTLVERYQPIVYRIAYSLLDSFHASEASGAEGHRPDPGLQAADATREALTAALNQIDELSAVADFSAWLTRLVVQTCLARLKRRRTQYWIDRIKQALLHPGRLNLSHETAPVPVTGREDALWQAFLSLEERDRAALVLRYEHHMMPHEIVLSMGGRERALQERLYAAREKLRQAWAYTQNPPQLVETEHPRFTRLIQTAADHQITDQDAAELATHLKSCSACQGSLKQFGRLEEALQTLFHQRWDQQAVPALEFSHALFGTHRRGHNYRNAFNLMGAAVVTLVVIGGVVGLPSLIPSSPLPALKTATPEATSAPARAFPPRPTPVTPPNDPNLLNSIYPGRLVFSTGIGYGSNQGTSGHLMTLLPNGNVPQSLDIGLVGASSPVWSPDGKQIAYLGYPDSNGSNEVYVAQADGSNAHQISPSSFTTNDNETINATPQAVRVRYPSYGTPQWSPDGRYVAAPLWLSPDNSSLQIFSLTGRPARSLDVFGLDRTAIKWSPDGRSIAYISGSGTALWIWNPNRPIVDRVNPQQMDLRPTWDTTLGMDWSPDSKQIALLTAVDHTPVEVYLFVLKADSSEYRVMPIKNGTLVHGWIRYSGVAWAPSGDYLALNLSYRDSDSYNSRLMLIKPDGNVLQTLANMDRAGVRDFTWSPDGRWVAFTSGFELWAASLDAYENQQVHLVKLAGMAGSQLSWQKIK